VSDLPRVVAVLGAGTIGSGWAALFASRGADVRIVDPDPAAPARAQRALVCARRLVPQHEHGTPGRIEPVDTLREALRDAAWVQESLPESLALKRRVLASLGNQLASDAIIASSTSTFTPSELCVGLPFAARLLVVHPLHPVYAVPVVELSVSPETSRLTRERAMRVLRAVGREPILVRGEVPGLVANRLTAALLRESLDLVGRGVVSARELDRLVARGVALGWATVGPLATERLGSGSLESFLDRYAEPLSRLWESLAQWHTLDDGLREAIVRSLSSTADGDADSADECAWAGALARLLRHDDAER
jgi:carnitine 3-dehydrogenase